VFTIRTWADIVAYRKVEYSGRRRRVIRLRFVEFNQVRISTTPASRRCYRRLKASIRVITSDLMDRNVRALAGSFKALKLKVLDLLDETEAIEILANLINPARVADFREMRELVWHAPDRRRFPAMITQLKDQIRELRSSCGVKASSDDLRTFLVEARGVPEHEVLWAHVILLTRLLSAYDDQTWPPHAQIMLDPHGTEPRWPQIEVRLLEATLYEDMCVLFNLARRTLHSEAQQVGNTRLEKGQLKTGGASCRATLTSAYYFLEGYLNGIAARYLVTHGESMEQETRDLLTEWDSKKKRPRWLPVREKILKFTRIVSGQAQSPIQENNCAELEVLTKTAKQLRDSIVHASPLPDHITRVPEKERAVFNVTLQDAERVVDAAIGFVRKIEIAVYGSDKLLHWLEARGDDGFFSETAFR
jgi:hypothetical protein